jgi:hypothetical protein
MLKRASKRSRLVVGEAWPMLGAGDDGRECRHHLAAVAHAEGEAVAAVEEGRELLGQLPG